MKDLGPLLRRMQKELGMTQREFAQELGVSPSGLSLWQRERRRPRKFAKIGVEIFLERKWPEAFVRVQGDGKSEVKP